jgi:hypothetical protein
MARAGCSGAGRWACPALITSNQGNRRERCPRRSASSLAGLAK